MKPARNISVILLAAAALWSLAVGGVSCGGGRGARPAEVPPSPDTVALVEGLRFFEDGKYDLSREQLSVSARSASTYIRAESFLYLNALEMEMANYDTAQLWLERYHLETVRLLRAAADSSRRMEEQAARLRRRHDMLVGAMILLAVCIAAAVAFFARRRRAAVLSGPGSPPSEPSADAAGWKHWLVDAEIFKQTSLWAEISALATQPSGRDARVLPSARQDALDSELAVRFAGFAAHLRDCYPSLTAGDIKLCCLSLLPLSPFGRALCFGSSETNIIKQRKHTIKKKLTADPRGRALFDFIFSQNGLA